MRRGSRRAAASGAPGWARHAATILLLCGLALTPATAGATAMFAGLGLETGGTYSRATGVSADGSTVVGIADGSTTSASGDAFRWTAGTGMVRICCLAGPVNSAADAASSDGSTVVGDSGLQAFRWTAAEGMVGLGFLPNMDASFATAVSPDGSTIAGGSYQQFADPTQPTTYQEAFRWTAAAGMVGLGVLPGANMSQATGVSADGSMVVGQSGDPTGVQAFLWTTTDGMTGLGFLPGGTNSVANAISADGSTIVGWGNEPGASEAFRWTAAGGMVGLGFLPGWSASFAQAVSADGSTIVGYDGSYANSEPFIWDAVHGMRSLRQVLIGQGADLTGWTLGLATGVSADGRTIVGYGTNPNGQQEAWIAVLPEPGTDALLLTGMLGLAVTRRRRASSV